MSSSVTPDPPVDAATIARGVWQPVVLVLGAVLSLLLVAAGALGLAGLIGGTPSAGPHPSNPLDGVRLGAFSPAIPSLGRGDLVAPWTHHQAGVLIFFAHWCPPCRRELPALAAAVGTGDVGGVQVVGVDEDIAGIARSFVAADHVRFPVGVDRAEGLAARLVPAGLPSAVFVDATGTVVDVRYGLLTPSQLLEEIRSLGGGRDSSRVPSRR